jgi:DNA-binding MarR family transcriptional regulator
MIFKARRKELAGYNITPEQAQILYVLGRMNSLTLNNLVDYTQHQHHSISTLINRMAKKGLVSKTRISDKGRKLNISITEKGQELLGIMSRESFSKVFACLSEEEKQEMTTYICRLLTSSYKALGKYYAPLCISELYVALAQDGS